MYGRGVELDTGSRFPCDLVEKTKQNRKHVKTLEKTPVSLKDEKGVF